VYGAVTLWGRTFQHVPLTNTVFDSPSYLRHRPTTPVASCYARCSRMRKSYGYGGRQNSYAVLPAYAYPFHTRIMGTMMRPVWAPSVSLAATQEMPGSYTVATQVPPQYTIRILVSFPPGTKMFQFPGCAPRKSGVLEVCSRGFPHSDISGSKVARHLPEAFRSHATSFFASSSQGIHRMPLGLLSGNLTTASHTSVIDRRVRVVSGALNANATRQVYACQPHHATHDTRMGMRMGMGSTKSFALCAAFAYDSRIRIMDTMMRPTLLTFTVTTTANFLPAYSVVNVRSIGRLVLLLPCVRAR
jgi:hypothetical protein